MRLSENDLDRDARPFRVGISTSFERNTPGLLQPIVDDVFQPYSFIELEEFEDGTVSWDAIRHYDATIADEPTIRADSFPQAVRTGVIARYGVGYNTIDVSACTRADIALAITTDAVRRPMSESIITLILALAKKLPTKHALVRTGRCGPCCSSTRVSIAWTSLTLAAVVNAERGVPSPSTITRIVVPFPWRPQPTPRAPDGDRTRD